MDEVAFLKARVIALEGLVEVLLRRSVPAMSVEEAVAFEEEVRFDALSGRQVRAPPRWEIVIRTLNYQRMPDE